MTGQRVVGLRLLHAVRLAGYAPADDVASRAGLGPAEAEGLLLDAEARGWVQQAAFAGSAGWSLTVAGRVEGERLLAAELDGAGGMEPVRAAYRDFLPINARVQRAATHWQLRPVPGDRLAVNDHADADWDAAVVDELAAAGDDLAPLLSRLENVLDRFGGYRERYAAALVRVRAGEGAWVDRTDVDSCHRVIFELHEDLIATLGIDRGDELSTSRVGPRWNT